MKKVLLGILIGILLCGTGFGVYYYFFKEEAKEEEKVETEEVKTETKTEELDINSNLVQELYSYVVNTQGYGLLFEKSVSDIDSAYKVALVYDLISESEKVDVDCSTIDNKALSLPSISCNASEGQNGIEGKTIGVEEPTMKRYVEKVFGPNSYQQIERASLIASELYFDQGSSTYVYYCANKGGYLYPYDVELTNALKNENKIELTIVVSENASESAIEGDEKLGTYKHIFNQNEDGNYYWTSNEKIK